LSSEVWIGVPSIDRGSSRNAPTCIGGGANASLCNAAAAAAAAAAAHPSTNYPTSM